MRLSLRLLALSFLTLSLPLGAGAQSSIPDTFTANLSQGSRGAQVLALQQFLNRDTDTLLADSGPGSPLNETNYFGVLTKSAVIRFQEKYASEVLAPAGLSQGSGFVGFYTRAKLNALNAIVTSAPVVPAPLPPLPLVPAATTTAQNPNLEHLDAFLSAIDSVAAKQGLSASAIALIKSQVMKDIATTTDLRAAFLKTVPATTTALHNSPVSGILDRIAMAFDSVFGLGHAQAATGVPFGGALLFSFFCNESDTWLITMEPLPPSFAVLLTYVPFSQLFLSYNTPFTPELLGQYAPGAGVCIVGAGPFTIFIPSEGMIGPILGSSPL